MRQSSAFPVCAALTVAAWLVSLPLLAAGNAAKPGTIMTVAGNGQPGFSGDGGPAIQAAVGTALGLGFDTAGDLFVAASGNIDRVRRITPAGIITTVAGSGADLFSGDGGPATRAGMHPVRVIADAAGSLYVADITNNRIRKVGASGMITTFAGGGQPADGLGDGGPATSARLNQPGSIALDARGNLFITEYQGHRVRMVDAAGTITTLAGTGKAGFSGDSGPAAAAHLDRPYDVAVDTAGHLYIADFGNHRIRMVAPDGTIHTVAGGGNPADGLGDGGLATDALLSTPTGLALDGARSLFIADSDSLRIRRVGPVGIITTVAGTGKAGFSGDGGPATQAELSGPFGVAVDQDGNLYFSDRGLVTMDGSDIHGADNERIREVLGVGVPR